MIPQYCMVEVPWGVGSGQHEEQFRRGTAGEPIHLNEKLSLEPPSNIE